MIFPALCPVEVWFSTGRAPNLYGREYVHDALPMSFQEMNTSLGFWQGIMEIFPSRQVGCLSGRVPHLHWTQSGKNHQPLQTALSGAYPYLAQDIGFTMHRAQNPWGNPVGRFRSFRGRYRPLLGGQGRYLANNWQKTLDHDRHSNDQHIHARLYPLGIQRMAHEDGRSSPRGSIELQSMGYRHQWQELGWPQV